MMSEKRFTARPDNPYHISVGAVLVNSEGKIACHHVTHYRTNHDGPLENLTLLMRESLEDDESLEICLARGLKEEFGATGEFTRFLGTIISQFTGREGMSVEKTTLYFLVKLVDIDEKLRNQDDEEAAFAVTWEEPRELSKKMKEQSNRYPQRSDLDESKIIETYLKTIKEVT